MKEKRLVLSPFPLIPPPPKMHKPCPYPGDTRIRDVTLSMLVQRGSWSLMGVGAACMYLLVQESLHARLRQLYFRIRHLVDDVHLRGKRNEHETTKRKPRQHSHSRWPRRSKICEQADPHKCIPSPTVNHECTLHRQCLLAVRDTIHRIEEHAPYIYGHTHARDSSSAESRKKGPCTASPPVCSRHQTSDAPKSQNRWIRYTHTHTVLPKKTVHTTTVQT